MRRPLPVGAADFKLLMAKRALKPFELTDSDVRQAVHAAPPGSLVFVLDHPELTGRWARPHSGPVPCPQWPSAMS